MFRSVYFTSILFGLLAVMLMPVTTHTLLIENDLLVMKSFAADADTDDSETYQEDSSPLGTPGVYPEWLGDEPETPVNPVSDISNDYTYEPYATPYYEPYSGLYSETDTIIYEFDKLDSIDYSLKVIAGGVILAIDSLFVWFMILKPLKRFIVF